MFPMENPPLEDPKNGGHGVLLRLPDGLEVCVGLRGRFQAEAAGGGLGHVFPALDLLPEVPGVRSAGLDSEMLGSSSGRIYS